MNAQEKDTCISELKATIIDLEDTVQFLKLANDFHRNQAHEALAEKWALQKVINPVEPGGV